MKGVYLAFVAIAGWAGVVGGSSPVLAQSLGAAETFALLGGTSVTAAGTGSIITGDVGVSPGTSITGFPAAAMVVPPFSTHVNDQAAIDAQTSTTALYIALANANPCSPLGPELSGAMIGPGTWCFSSTANLAATGTLILDGAGTYIFQVGSDLTANVMSTVVLLNGADPCDVFWQVTGAATLNGVNFVGTVVAQAAITLGVDATLTGRALTTAAGAVTLAGTNTVGGCSVVAAPTETPTDTPTNTPTDTPTATPTDSATQTSTATATATPTQTATATDSATQTSTATPTQTATATATGTATGTPTSTPTNTSTVTGAATSTPTQTASVTATGSATTSPTLTATATATSTPSGTFVAATVAATVSATPTVTVSQTPTNTPTASATRTAPPIPVMPTPSSGAGLLLISGLALSIGWMLRRSARSTAS